MKLIVGLGNPGSRYNKTRHNVGFGVVARLAELHHIRVSGTLGPSVSGKGEIAGEPVILIQPTTYMNRSGEAVLFAVRKLKLTANDILVIHDDMDLPVGKIRMREAGSSGGHNGLKSIIASLGTQDFARLKVGIDHPPASEVIDYVLERFDRAEQPLIEEAMERAAAAAAAWVEEGVEKAASRFNG